MKLSMKGMAVASALLWGGGVLFVALLNLAFPSYGTNFLQMVSSAYPWYHASRNIGDVVIGTADALVDGATGGFLFAWIYNHFSGSVARG